MAIVSIFVVIAGLIAFVVGVVISVMWYHAAFASLYQSVLNQSDEENPIPILGVNEV
jgi:cell division protein FtsX